MSMQQNSSANFSAAAGGTVDPAEVAKFSKLSAEWWDPNGKMAPLHKINPLRLSYIRDAACRKFERNVKSLNCLSGLRIQRRDDIDERHLVVAREVGLQWRR